jgi:endoglycosylceramidase
MRRSRSTWPAVVAGLAVVTALAGGNLGARGGAALPPSPSRPLTFLHVGPVSGPSGLHQVVDENGREVLLKGVNVDGITDYFHGGNHPLTVKLENPYSFNPADYTGGQCVPDVRDVEGVPLCSLDFQQLRPLGYNVIRLTLSWSLLEPTVDGGIDLVGTPSHMYMDRIAQVVAWAKAEGIYVLLDLHQDTWSKYDYTTAAERPSCLAPLQGIDGADGAPEWASRQHPAIPNCAPNGIAQLSPAVEDDFRALYNDAAGIPSPTPVFSHFKNVFLALAKRFHNEPAVAGYEMFNEPLPGYLPTAGVFDQTELFPMYGKVIKNVTDNVAGFHQLFFVEPNALRNSTDQSANFLPWSTFSSYANVVYTPHIYTGVFTLDSMAGQRGVFPSNGGYTSSISDASLLGLPLFVSEFGNSPQDDNTILRTHYQLQDADQVGGTLWLWKENFSGQWGVYMGGFDKGDTHGTPRPSRIKLTDRAYPLLTAGHLQTFVYNPENAAFDLHATSPAVSRDARAHDRGTLLFVPAAVTCGIQSENADLELFDRGGGSREVYAYPRGGDYRVFCGDVNAGSGRPGGGGPAGHGSDSGLPKTSR